MIKKKILVVDDTHLMIKLITDILESSGYEVVSASSGIEGLKKVQIEKPDLVILDIVMPDMSGFEVCRILRNDVSNNLMPIIMLTSQCDEDAKLKGLELGADDYIIKPFNPRELVSRVKNTLIRLDRNRWANPLTGLSGNNEIKAELKSRIARKDKFAVLYVDLDNFKAFNDVYGFVSGDRSIKLIADILVDNVELHGQEGDFVGHIGGDDFIIVTDPKVAIKIADGVIKKFDIEILKLYKEEDIKKGYIKAIDRLGNDAKIPIMSVSIAIVTNEKRNLNSLADIEEATAEVKKQAKMKTGSVWVYDE